MKVKELIEELSNYDPELTVFMTTVVKKIKDDEFESQNSEVYSIIELENKIFLDFDHLDKSLNFDIDGYLKYDEDMIKR